MKASPYFQHYYRPIAKAPSPEAEPAASSLGAAAATSSSAAASSAAQLSAKSTKKREVKENACQRCRNKKIGCRRRGTGKTERCEPCRVAGTRCEYSPSSNKVVLQKQNEALQCQLEAAEDQIREYQNLVSRIREYENLVSRIRKSSTMSEVSREIQVHDQNSAPEEQESSSNESLILSLHPASTISRSDSLVSPFSQDGEMMFSPTSDDTSLSEASKPSFAQNDSMSSDTARALTDPLTESYASREILPRPHFEVYGIHQCRSGTAIPITTSEYSATLTETSDADLLIQELWRSDLTMLSSPCTTDLMKFQNLVYEGVPVSLVLGGDFVCIDSLIGEIGTLSHLGVPQWGSDFLKPLQMDFHMKLALAVVYTRFMRWLIRPTVETYSMMPPIMRPTPMERLTPHAASTYMAVTSLVRGSVLNEHKDWQPILERYLRLKCPDNPKTYAIDCVDGHYKATPEFERHVGNYSNWFFDRRVLEEYPDLIDQVQVDYGSSSPEEEYQVIASEEYLGLAPKMEFD